MKKAILLMLMAFVVLAIRTDRANAQEPPYDFRAAYTAAERLYAEKNFADALVQFDSVTAALNKIDSVGNMNGDLRDLRARATYNAACCAALAGDAEKGFYRLKVSVEQGVLDKELVMNDTDLVLLRKDRPRWSEVIQFLDKRISELEGDSKAGVVILPTGPDAAAPTRAIVALHGGGGNVEQVEAWWQRMADKTGMAVIIVRGSQIYDKGVFGYNQRDPRSDKLHITQWIDKAKEAVPGLDTNQLLIAGYSQGGGMAALLAMEDPGKWKGAILHGPYVQLALRDRARQLVPNRPPMVIMVGEMEEDGVRTGAEILAAPAEGAAEVRVITIPGAAHELTPDHEQRTIDAIKWLTAPRPM